MFKDQIEVTLGNGQQEIMRPHVSCDSIMVSSQYAYGFTPFHTLDHWTQNLIFLACLEANATLFDYTSKGNPVVFINFENPFFESLSMAEAGNLRSLICRITQSQMGYLNSRFYKSKTEEFLYRGKTFHGMITNQFTYNFKRFLDYEKSQLQLYLEFEDYLGDHFLKQYLTGEEYGILQEDPEDLDDTDLAKYEKMTKNLEFFSIYTEQLLDEMSVQSKMLLPCFVGYPLPMKFVQKDAEKWDEDGTQEAGVSKAEELPGLTLYRYYHFRTQEFWWVTLEGGYSQFLEFDEMDEMSDEMCVEEDDESEEDWGTLFLRESERLWESRPKDIFEPESDLTAKELADLIKQLREETGEVDSLFDF